MFAMGIHFFFFSEDIDRLGFDYLLHLTPDQTKYPKIAKKRKLKTLLLLFIHIIL